MKYSMIDSVMSDLERCRGNIDKEFKAWYNLATTITQQLVVQPSVRRLGNCWKRFRSNVENEIPIIKKL